jgi:diguanylate cyclase (GGDEF)-like protein
VKDRLLAFSVAAGCAALAVGLIFDAAGFSESGTAAGALGFVAAVLAAAIASRLAASERELVRTRDERNALRRELDALAAIFADEASTSRNAMLPLATPVPKEAVMDTASGLLAEQHFQVLVHKRLAAARRQLQPISIVMFEIDGLTEATTEDCNQGIGILGRVIVSTLRESDAACRIGRSAAAAILEDTSEAGAVWAAERIRGSLVHNEIEPEITVSAGIACYPSHALSAPELMERAGRALESARAQGRDRLEVATSD